MTDTIRAAETCIAEAARLRRLGLSPIPILRWMGHCPVGYAEYREGGMPPEVFEGIVGEHKAHGIQCFTSAAWRNVVVDCDGREGVLLWDSWCRRLGCPPTWKSITPRGGIQWWFDVPPDVDHAPSVHFWKAEGRHAGLELIGDGFQARCWPSYKPVEGRKVPYVWEAGSRPGEVKKGVLPRWAIDLASALRPAGGATFPAGMSTEVARRPSRRPVGPRRLAEWSDVRDAIAPGEKLRLAESWGLQAVSRRPNDGGWVKCRSIFREDRHPSASFCVRTGGYWEEGLGTQNFFWLAIQLGAYADFNSAIEDIARMAGMDRRTA